MIDDLPADILVIFGGLEHDAEELEFHWISSREKNLISPGDLPDAKPLLPFHGQLHRSYDYAGLPEAFERYRRPWCLAQIEGTKIGGLPRWIQSEEEVAGRFLCAVGSVGPVFNRPYPYVNVENPIEWSDPERAGRLIWGDMGSLYLFVNDDGDVRGIEQCY